MKDWEWQNHYQINIQSQKQWKTPSLLWRSCSRNKCSSHRVLDAMPNYPTPCTTAAQRELKKDCFIGQQNSLAHMAWSVKKVTVVHRVFAFTTQTLHRTHITAWALGFIAMYSFSFLELLVNLHSLHSVHWQHKTSFVHLYIDSCQQLELPLVSAHYGKLFHFLGHSPRYP